jgi:F-type H+-transporting ATPase subunit b
MTMRFAWSTFALQTVNFAILVWLLHRFLYRPVLGLLDARRAEIDKQYADAQMAETKAKEELAAIEAERAGIAAERAATLAQASAQAVEAAAARRAQAEREAAELLDAARKALAAERGLALAEARRAALDLGTDIAGRLLAEVPIELRAEAWLARIEAHLAALPQTQRDALARQLVDGARLTVVTASALPAETAEAWRARLTRTLGDGIAIGFGTDRHLVAGAELHFPNAVLRFSWHSALAAMRAEIDGDAR